MVLRGCRDGLSGATTLMMQPSSIGKTKAGARLVLQPHMTIHSFVFGESGQASPAGRARLGALLCLNRARRGSLFKRPSSGHAWGVWFSESLQVGHFERARARAASHCDGSRALLAVRVVCG